MINEERHLNLKLRWSVVLTVIVQNANKLEPPEFFNYRLQNGRLALRTEGSYRSTNTGIYY